MQIQGEEVFTIPYQHDRTKALVYAPLRGYLALVGKELADGFVEGNPSNAASQLLARVKTRKLVDLNDIRRVFAERNPDLSLAITDDCSLRCVYCHASAGEPHKQSSLSTETIDAILEEYFSRIAPGPLVRINFNGGGEPTHAFRAMAHAISRATALASGKNSKCAFVMATNGYYGNDIREYIVSHFGSVSLSLDGPQFIHDKHRPTKSGTGSYDTVYGTARYFYERAFPFAFRATVSNYNIDYLKDTVDFFIDHFPKKTVSLEFLNPYGRALCCTDALVVPPDKERFSREMVSILEYCKDKPIKILNAASTEYDILRLSFCSNVGCPNWTVTTRGDVVACQRDNAPDQFVFGRFDSSTGKVLIDEEKVARLHEMSVLNYNECGNCFCKYHCAGDCPDRRLSDKSDCASIRRIGTWVLAERVRG